MALVQQNAGWQDIPNSAPMLGNDQIGQAARYAEQIAAMTADAPADLPASGNWPGRRIWVISTRSDWRWITDHWEPAPTEETANITQFSTGWAPTNTAGYQPRLWRVGSHVEMAGAVNWSAGGAWAAICTVPEAFRPVTNLPRFVGSSVAAFPGGAAGAVTFILNAAGLIQVPSGYLTNTASPAAVPLLGSWRID